MTRILPVAWSLILCLSLHAAEPLSAGVGGVVFLDPAPTEAPDGRIAPGRLYVEPSTLHCVSFEWEMSGDPERLARVALRYRPAEDADAQWRPAMDLLRMNGEYVAPALAEDGMDFTCPNQFAGSIFGLQPGTLYDVELRLVQPDGSDQTHIVRVSTKVYPTMGEAIRRIPVSPDDDLQAVFADARPGDHYELAPGTYLGSYRLVLTGSRAAPIVIRPAGDGEVVFQGTFHSDGSGRETNGLDISGSSYLWIEGITFDGHNYGVCELNDPVVGLTISRCRFINSGWSGIMLRSPLNRDILITDNVCLGSEREGSPLAAQRKFPYKGIWVTGQGVDVCYNRVQNAKDGISVYGGKRPPSVEFERKIAAMCFYRNDIGQTWDDNEADGGQANIRFWENHFVDMHVGLSAQPVYGGPCYFIRNVLYNITRGTVLKLNHEPAGVIALHNTFVSYGNVRSKGVAAMSRSWSNVYVRNNVFLGMNGATLSAGPKDPERSQLDYNAYAVVKNIAWYTPTDTGKMTRNSAIKTLDDLAAHTHNEAHHKVITFADFVDVPEPRGEEKTTWSLDFGDARPTPDSPVIDAALPIPNINDVFSGDAPDIGAYEAGQERPHYGPREATP